MPKPVDPGTDESTLDRVSFERLRERTDELELLISGLALLALLGLPGWLWECFELYYARMPLQIMAAVVVLLPMLNAVCFVIATLLLLHLAVRAHWVGLIGLKAVFPDGIRWERVRGIGPITVERLQRRMPDLQRAIASADRLASTLFSLITFTAISLGLLGLWMTTFFLIGGLFGRQLGGTNYFINIALTTLFAAFLGAPLLRWILDGWLGRWLPALAHWRPYRWLIVLVGWFERAFFPTRLLAGTRLALQSQLLPRTFFPLFVLAVLAIAALSNQWFQSGRGFDVMSSQRFVTGGDLQGGYRSSYYQSQRIPRDRARGVPVIPAPVIETAWLPVFLPYLALIDDPVLMRRCPERLQPPAGEAFPLDASDTDAAALQREADGDANAEAAAACLRRLWAVRLDNQPVPLDDFVVAERADLGMRGLVGYLALNGLSAGPHRLEIVWRPQPEQDQIDEDFVPRRIRHLIPFIWSPENAATPRQP
ncbi:MAG: hypothetical protein KDI48_00535 [Xanthomonadales bacterium]|nr:hypothetical protein [Xanthomonadales bacterium]